ncbi:MAG: enoyl-ACP reductase [Deltaproteobacteria bacterium]|nr:enoyl-ACP reductase [Deltaproteobacteria bacterium]
MGLLDGKKAAIFGVANERSIAWGIAGAMKKEGAELAFTYGGANLESRVRPLAEQVGSRIIMPCDVTNDGEVDAFFDTLKSEWGSLDILVHSVAFAKKEELKGEFLNTSREGFFLAMDVSAYSLVSLLRRAAPLMEAKGGSVITLTYLGSERVIPNYNVMGVAKAALETSVRYLASDLGPRNIRVNAVSAGPIKTLAAMGISGFREILDLVEKKAPLRRNITLEDIAGATVYLASDLSRGVTGEILYVDSGFNIMGM